jgi:hypothetical protein
METTKENIERMNAKYKISGDKGRKQLDLNLVIWFGCICEKNGFLICESPN